MRKHIISVLSLFVLIVVGKLFISSSPADSSASAYQTLFEHKYNIFALNVPHEVDFCGERVPLEDREINERFDRELHVNTYWQSQTLLLIKRANRYFPVIRPILKKNGIPDDFKYLPLIESGFQDMVSPAGAEGPWQFMAGTGREYKLEINGQVDERYHIAKATEAACDYLRYAYRVFGNWTLVAASYNVGVPALQRALARQKVGTYYDLDLNTQTARYVFRLLAIKEVMEHPKRYGFRYRKFHLYQPFATYKVKVDSTVNDLVGFAKKQGVSYKTLREYNPWLKSDKLINVTGKTYYLNIPKYKQAAEKTVEEEPVYEVPLQEESFTTDSSESKANGIPEKSVQELLADYTVKNGDNIATIARKFRVRSGEVMVWNALRTPSLKPGQVLKIYRKPIGKDKDTKD